MIRHLARWRRDSIALNGRQALTVGLAGQAVDPLPTALAGHRTTGSLLRRPWQAIVSRSMAGLSATSAEQFGDPIGEEGADPEVQQFFFALVLQDQSIACLYQRTLSRIIDR